jgi:hypothetical protein
MAPLRLNPLTDRSEVDFRPKLDNTPGGCGQGLPERAGLDVFEIQGCCCTDEVELRMVENVKRFQAQFDPSVFVPSELLC